VRFRRFLSRFVNLFPDETYNLLLGRIERRASQGEWRISRVLRSFGLLHANISFGGVPAEKRHELGRDCVTRLIASDSPEKPCGPVLEYRGHEEPGTSAHSWSCNLRLMNEARANISMLIGKAIPTL